MKQRYAIYSTSLLKPIFGPHVFFVQVLVHGCKWGIGSVLIIVQLLCNLILSSITQKCFEKIRIRELLIKPTYNKNVMATFNVKGYLQVFKPTLYTCTCKLAR